jgi:ABC-type uncharacterized transport system permease subunit
MMAVRLYLLEAFVLLWLIGTPLSILIAWWLWFRRRSSYQPRRWRQTALLLALLASSTNALIYSGYLAYWSRHQLDTQLWKTQKTCGDIATYLCLTAFIGAVAGEGQTRTRVLISVSAVLGFMVWVPIGIL